MIRVRTLGQCTIQIGALPVGPEAEMVFAALLLLTLEPGTRLTRAELLGTLWPEVPGPRAAHCLRQTIYRLRTLGVPLTVDRTHLTVSPDAVDCDVDALLRTRRGDDVERVADGIGGAFLPGYAPTFSEPLRDWVERHRDLVTAAARRVLVGAIAARKARAEWPDVERLAHRCLAIDPLNEEATLALAEAAALHGGKAEAMGILDRYLREMGPTARELRLPAMALRRRIAEPEQEFPLAPPLHVPFVGRSAEMLTLTAALRSARGGVGSVHFIHGEPGIGKTRLLTEFSRAASLDGARIAPVLCQSSDVRRPLSAFVDLVPKLMTMPGALGCSPQSHKYLRRLIEHHSSDSPPTPDTAEAAILYANVRRSLLDLLDAIASEEVLIVSVDDVHWLDSASWEITDDITAWLQTRRILLLMTSREPDSRLSHAHLSRRDNVRSLGLGPLTRSACETLFDATIRGQLRETRQAFMDWCVETSGGNPYYLSELALHGLTSHGGFKVPQTLSDLVAQRVAHLRPVSRRVLQACAILGKDATVDRVERMLDQRRLELLDGLDELDEHVLIAWDGSRIVSRHDLLSQAAVDSLSPLSRRLLHQHAASVLEAALPQADNPTLAWRSAEHWTLGGAPDRGAALACRCARQAIELGRPADAVDLLRQTKALPLTTRSRLDVVRELLYAYRACDQWEDATVEFAELRSLRTEYDGQAVVHDETELIGIQSQWLGGFATKGIVDQLLQCCRSAHANADHRVAAAKLCLIVSDNLRDVDTAEHAFALVKHELHIEPGQTAERLEVRLIFEASFGNRQLAESALEILLRAAPALPTRQRASSVLLAAHACERLGLVQRVFCLALEAYTLAVECSSATAAIAAARRLAWTYLEQGEDGQAQQWYESAVEWADKAQLSSFRADLYGLQAELKIRRGEFAEAEEALMKSSRAWGQTVHSRWRLGVLSASCAIWLATGQRSKCEETVQEYGRLLLPLYGEEGNDTVAARYFMLLAHLGRRNDAAAELRKYVSGRSEPSLYGVALQAAIQDLWPCAGNELTASQIRPSEGVRPVQ